MGMLLARHREAREGGVTTSEDVIPTQPEQEPETESEQEPVEPEQEPETEPAKKTAASKKAAAPSTDNK